LRARSTDVTKNQSDADNPCNAVVLHGCFLSFLADCSANCAA